MFNECLQVYSNERISLLGGDAFVPSDTDLQPLAEQFISLLQQAVYLRVRNRSTLCAPDAAATEAATTAHQPQPPRVAVLFSGGVDSTVLASLTDRCLPPHEIIELINVAFDVPGGKFQSPDRLSGLRALMQLQCVLLFFVLFCSYVLQCYSGCFYSDLLFVSFVCCVCFVCLFVG